MRRGDYRYQGSSFLKHTVANIRHLSLPRRFFVTQHQTVINPMYVREERDMQRWEWHGVKRICDAWDMPAVVVNANNADHPPILPGIVNLIGTRLVETVEILKRADGYVGIDSWLSCLAAQLFPADRLVVRGPDAWVKRYKDIYYRPHTRFDFLVDSIGTPPRVLL